MINCGLVLEGGGMKGMYTAGVLEYFMEKELYFANCYGVSAGACHLCSYISKQKKRAYRVALDYLNDKNYCSMHSLMTTGDLFNAKMCYDTIPNKLVLDNAIESAENITGGCIELDIKKEASSPFTVITLVNSCRISPFSKDGRRLVSHKKNPLRHGYGMKSIERVVSKYSGEMNTYFDSESAAFHTIIMLRNQ